MNESILALIKNAERREVPEGTAILEEGGQSGLLYVLVQGEVEVIKRGVVVAKSSEPGAIFGEISVLLGTVHMATVKTTKPSAFYVANEGRDFLLSHPELTLHVSSLLARRLNLVTAYLVDLKKQYAKQMDHLGMVDEVLETLLQRQSSAAGRRPVTEDPLD